MTINEFVRNLWENDQVGAYAEPMDIETAKTDLANYAADGWTLPEGITPEAYMEAWNDMVPKKIWWIIDVRDDQTFETKTTACSKEDAVRKARAEWNALSDHDRNRRSEFYVGYATENDGCVDYDTMFDVEYIKQ